MQHHETEIEAPEPVAMAWKLLLYTVAGAIGYGLLTLFVLR